MDGNVEVFKNVPFELIFNGVQGMPGIFQRESKEKIAENPYDIRKLKGR
jgi:hypothetical protein